MKADSVVPALKDIVSKERRRQQLHISGINMLNECGQRFFYRYILGVKSPPGAFLLVGKACDQSVTKNLDSKIETGELLPRADAIGIAESSFDDAQKSEPIELDADEKREGKSLVSVLGEAKDKTVALAGLHYDEAAPLIRPKRTQRKFSINMDGFLRSRAKELHSLGDAAGEKYSAKILHAQGQALNAAARDGLDFAGEQDITEEYEENGQQILVVRDTKTSGKSPTKSLMDGSDKPGFADDSEQLTAYAVASHVIDGKLPDLMVLDYLVRTEAGNKFYKPTKTVRDMNDINTFLNRFANAVHAIRSGIFVPTKPDDWRCSKKWCGYFDMCPYAKRPKQFVNIEVQKQEKP